MKIVLSLLLSFFIKTSLFAQDSHKFCEALISSNQTSHQTSKASTGKVFKFYLTYFFNPKKLVKLESLKDISLPEKTKPESNKVLINLFKNTTFKRSDKLKLKNIQRGFKSEWSSFSQSHLQSLKGFNDLDLCLDYVQSQNIEKKLTKINSLYIEQIELQQKRNEANSYKLLTKFSKSFKNNGWKVFHPKSINDIHDIISKNSNSTILLVGHATPEGKIRINNFDLPSSFFRNTQINNLIIYTCYPEEVLKHYNISELSNVHEYLYPQLSPIGENLLPSDKIPLNSLRTVLIHRYKESSQLTAQFQCSLSFQTTSKKQSVFLNKMYLGGKENSLLFDCSILKEQNLLEVYSLEDKEMTSFKQLETVYLNDGPISLDVFTSKLTGKHIVSKKEFDYKFFK